MLLFDMYAGFSSHYVFVNFKDCMYRISHLLSEWNLILRGDFKCVSVIS